MPRKRVKVEFQDGQGGRYVMSLEGDVSREKVLKMIDVVELLGGSDEKLQGPAEGTQFWKVHSLVEDKFPLGTFTSSEILEAYEDHYSEPVRLSTISTYLSRLTEKGLLNRQRSGNNWAYRRAKAKAAER